MSTNNTLITVLSWEDRFRLSTEQLLQTETLTKVVLYFYSKNRSWTKQHHQWLRAECAQRRVHLVEQEIKFDDAAATWNNIGQCMNHKTNRDDSILVDITTMPRDVIWTVFSFALERNASARYIYRTPQKYNDKWLSRDPGRPRVLFKHSGIAEFGKPTLLAVTTGFDLARTEQLVNFYEPRDTLLFVQAGSQFDNVRLNTEKHKTRFIRATQVHINEIDAYSEDHGMRVIEDTLNEYKTTHNVVATSLGPKISAVALYKLWQRCPNIALSYAPTNEYNHDYSRGMNKTFGGEITSANPSTCSQDDDSY